MSVKDSNSKIQLSYIFLAKIFVNPVELFVCLFVSVEPFFQGRPIRFRIIMPSPFYPYRTSSNRTVLQANALLARSFGSLGSTQSQCTAKRQVSRCFYCFQLRRVSQRRHLFPLYDIFVTQRAPLAASECLETVPLCFPTADISSRGVQPQVLRILCFSTAASTLTALVGRGV